MNAIVLAAGEGKRLRPLTNNKPKCFVELFGKTLLEWQLSVFKKCGIKEICIVTGHYSEMIEHLGLDYVVNRDFKTTNMMESLFCARDRFSESTIVSYSDIIFNNAILESLINAKEDFSVIIDKNWRECWEMRFDDPVNDAESLRTDDEGYITSIGKKVTTISEIEGQYIGLMKFQNNAINKISKFYDKCKNESEIKKKNPLNPKISFRNSYMTDFLQGLIDDGEKIKSINVKNGWLELDSISDYNLYTNLDSSKAVSKFFDGND